MFAEADPGSGQCALVRASEKLRITGNSVPSGREASQTGGTGKSQSLRELWWRFGAGSGSWYKWHWSVSHGACKRQEDTEPFPIRHLRGGGRSSGVAGHWQRGCCRNAASLRDQLPPGHACLVLGGFGQPRGGVWVKEPSPHACLGAPGGVRGSGWPRRRAVLCCSPLAWPEDVRTRWVPAALSTHEVPVLPLCPRRHRPH